MTIKNMIDTIGSTAANGASELGRSHKDITADKVKALIGDFKVKEAIFYESMTQAIDPNSGARIRVWRKDTELPQYNDIELQHLISQIPGSAGMKDVIDIISTVDGVTAIELVDPNGNGAVAYFEW